MPTYEYECTQCGYSFEVFQSMSDEPVKDCVKCGNTVRRLIFGGAGVIFKGSGFYVTDKRKGPGKASKTESKKTETPAAKDASAGSTAGDAKTAAASSGASGTKEKPAAQTA